MPYLQPDEECRLTAVPKTIYSRGCCAGMGKDEPGEESLSPEVRRLREEAEEEGLMTLEEQVARMSASFSKLTEVFALKDELKMLKGIVLEDDDRLAKLEKRVAELEP